MSETDVGELRKFMSIVQIARRAGVSPATVSRVLNDHPSVRSKTKNQVRAAAEALNYVAPLVKRGPKPGRVRKPKLAQRTRTIAAVLVGNERHSFLAMPVIAKAFSGLTRAAAETGHRVLVEEMWDLEIPSPAVANGDVDGVVAFLNGSMKPAGFSTALESMQRCVPVVWAMGGDAGVTDVDHVVSDDRAIARLAFDYLVERGCKELAYFSPNAKWAMMRNRGQHFAGLAHDAGLKWTAYVTGDHPRDGELFGARTVIENSIEKLVDRLLSSPSRPDGIFLGNDATTALVHPLLLQRGIKLGEEILLVSCDNEEIRLSGLLPRPMSIDIGSAEVGSLAVRQLLYRLDNPTSQPVLIKVAPFVPVPGTDESSAPLYAPLYAPRTRDKSGFALSALDGLRARQLNEQK